MAEPLKLLLNEALIQTFSAAVCRVYPDFDADRFTRLVFDENWDDRELKPRIRHITLSLGTCLPADYEESLHILTKVAPHCRGFEYLFLPDYVEAYGLPYWNASIEALRLFTPCSSSEFAVRPFIEKHPEAMMAVMRQWAEDANEHVRRLASEGCRPRLPWAPPLRSFIADPSPILPILERLRADDSEYVRRSVANNLNDISKDHPELVKRLVRSWKGEHPHTDWILKHGCRSLLRKADPDTLELFEFNTAPVADIRHLTLSTAALVIGEALTFEFELVNPGPDTQKLRLEFGVDYVKANGTTSRKLFKMTENLYAPGSYRYSRNLSFRNLTTRTHYPGPHRIAIVVNGRELASEAFLLTAPADDASPSKKGEQPERAIAK